jgi:hypothetical protein
MIVRKSGPIVDPLAKEPAGRDRQTSFEQTGALTSSFVFIESSAQTPKITRALSRHSTSGGSSTLLLSDEEKQAIIHSCRLVCPQVSGDPLGLVLTNYRILIVPDDDTDTCTCIYSIPLSSILEIKTKETGSICLGIDIKTKDCRFFQLVCEDSGINKTSLVSILNWLVFSKPISTSPSDKATRTINLFALTRKKFLRHSSKFFTWESEFERLRNDSYTICCLNHDYSICATYPSKFFVPKNIADDVIIGSAKFRDKGRIPVLCWVAPKGSNLGGSIWRSSQPKSSLLNRSSTDEEYLKKIEIMYIIDCRPMLNAYANIANSGGVESLGNYHSGIQLWFASIQNIHHVRESWEKMFMLCQQFYTTSNGGSTSGWFSGLESTGWYEHISTILRAVSVLVEKISSGLNVLCRCSHGLDRTPQVVSLGMLCVDAYYRTFEGFAVLIEKEWVAMGHRFGTRYCFGTSPSDEVSPIFSQFLECVYQLLDQFPSAFEFSDEYLSVILHGMMSGRFRNFLFDSEKERMDRGGEDMWEYLDRFDSTLRNKNYSPIHSTLMVDYRISMMKVFSNVWLRPDRVII